MASVRENCEQWIDLAYDNWLGWLRDEKGKTYLRESTKNMIERMWYSSKDQHRQEEAWNLVERLKKLGNNFTQLEEEFGTKSYLYEHAEIYLECALAAYKMGDLQESLSLFKVSLSGFPNRTLHKAVGYWLYGCIQWQSQSHREDALISWEKSLQIVKDVGVDNSHDQHFSNKCTEIAKKAKDAILGASINNYPPPVYPKAEPNQNPSNASRNDSARSAPRARTAKLRIFPIIGSIPAGSPMIVDDPDKERVAFEGLEIHGEFYSAYSLTDDFDINIVPGKTYFLLKVTGDSMNNASPVNIEDGDYVLMIQQKTAETGDIVAAEINNMDHAATLKKYFKKEKQHILRPESKNSESQGHFTFTNDFVIRGIAIAVLKRDE